MRRVGTKGGFLLRSHWLRLLIIFVIFGVIFAVFTHKAQRSSASDKAQVLPTTGDKHSVAVRIVEAPVEVVEIVEMDSIFDFSVNNIDGELVRLNKYKNRVSLIVNGATV